MKEGQEKFREEEWPEAIGGDLKFIALRGFGTRGGYHDAGIVDEDVETGFLGLEGIRGGFNGCQVGEVELQEGNFSYTLGGGGPDGGDGGVGFALAAASDVDGAVAAVKDFCELEADASVAASYNDDATFLVWEVGFGERRFGQEERLVPEAGEDGHCSAAMKVGQ